MVILLLQAGRDDAMTHDLRSVRTNDVAVPVEMVGLEMEMTRLAAPLQL